MPAPVFISLNKEEDSTLYELSIANGVPRRTKLRAIALRLNATGWTVARIAAHLQQSQQAVRQTLLRWQNQGLAGLWEAAGRGKKRCWQEEDLKAVEAWLEEESSYTSRQLSEKLAKERGVEIEAKWLQRLLKKRGGYGSGLGIVLPNQSSQNTTKQNWQIG
jgi:transposase